MKLGNILAALACISLVACSSMRVIPTTDLGSGAGGVRAGDTVRIQTADGGVVSGRIKAIEDDAIAIGNRRVPIDDITRLEVKRPAGGKTLLFLIGLGLFYAMLRGFANAFEDAIECSFAPEGAEGCPER